jgi:hypothetical protein
MPISDNYSSSRWHGTGCKEYTLAYIQKPVVTGMNVSRFTGEMVSVESRGHQDCFIK